MELSSDTRDMKRARLEGWLAVLVSIFIVVGAVWLASCTSPEAAAAEQELEETYASATADGVVSTAEQARLQAAFDKWREQVRDDLKARDWSELIGTALSSIVGTLVTARAIPNRMILGRREAEALDHLARPVT